MRWDSILNAKDDRAPIYCRCMVCGRKDATVAAYLFVTDGQVKDGLCPAFCDDCMEDEPSQDELARKATA